jgi:hypothetical protein
MTEEWKPVPIPEFDEFYEVSSLGRVRSLSRQTRRHYVQGRILKPGRHGGGYLNIMMSIDGVRAQRLVHQLVLGAFVGLPEPGQEGRHLNGDSTDNRQENLVWGTSGENEADKILHGTSSRGSGNAAAKLEEWQVLEIRRRYADGGESQRALAAVYGVGQGAISRLVTGARWGHLG